MKQSFAFACALAALLVPALGRSQTPLSFNVTVTADAADANVGDLRCDSDGSVDGDQCTLRAAIQEANALGGAFINLDEATYTLTIAGAAENEAATGDLDVNVSGAPNEMIITGQGPDKTVVQACDDSGGPCAGIDRVFDIGPLFPGAIVTIRDLTIRNGLEPDLGGGGLVLKNIMAVPETAGGGLRNFGHSILENVVVTHNDSVGVYSEIGSVLEISDGVVSDSTGLGIENRGEAALERTSVRDNQGPGLHNNGGTLRFVDGVISGNSAGEGAGFDNGGDADLVNVVISGNFCTGYGGGIAQISDVVLNLNNVTITDNTSDSDKSGNGDGGGLVMSAGTVNFKNTIIAGNKDENGGLAPDCFVSGGVLVSQGYNLMGDDGGCVFTTGTGDQRGTTASPIDARLDPVTQEPLPGSPAIDRGNPAAPGSGGDVCETDDGRGVLRPQDGDSDGTATCDIGALEVGCGDGLVEPGEECDDGNKTDGDGCGAACQAEVAGTTGGGTTGGTTGGEVSGGTTTGGTTTGGSGGGTLEPLDGGGCSLLRPHSPIKTSPLKESLGKIPLSFEANRGQTDSQVKFLSRGRGYALFLTPTESVLSLSGPSEGRHAVLRMSLVGANTKPQIRGVEGLRATTNYFIGNDPKKWHAGVPNYARVEYQDVAPGVDLVYHGDQEQLEYDVVVQPGADPKSVTLAFQGTERIEIDGTGALVLHLAGGKVVQHRPIVYQEEKGTRKTVSGSYVLKGKDRAGFRVAAYDTSKPLVIDPVLSYSTYLGGGGADVPNGYDNMAVDFSGAVYVVSSTASTDFPTMNEYQVDPGDAKEDVSVTKLDPSQSGSAQLVYSTYLGGNGADDNGGVAVDAAGNVYVTGYTKSTDFPVKNGYQGSLASGGFYDAFLVKLDPARTGSESLVYGTYLGGGSDDYGYGVAVDASGVAYVVGQTWDTDFPTRNAYDATGSAPDAFVAKIDPAQSGDASLLYATFLGGTMDVNAYEAGIDIAPDAAGHIYVTGVTAAKDFPVQNAFQPNKGDPTAFNAFVTKLDPTQSGSAQLLYSTYLGGAVHEIGYGIAVDTAGMVYLVGQTSSSDFPTRNPFQDTLKGTQDAFVAKLDPTQSGDPSLLYSTYLGGDGKDYGQAIALDPLGKVYVTGDNNSSDFPTRNAFQTKKGTDDAFIARFDLSQTGDASLLFSTNLGGDGFDEGDGLAVDSSCNVYLAGDTNSGNFPTVGPFQDTLKGASDNFVAKITLDSPPAPSITSPLTASGMVGEAFSYTLTADGATPMTFEASNLPDGLAFSGTDITGTPTTAGTTNVTLTATNSDCLQTQTLVVTIAATAGGTTGGTTGGTAGGTTGGTTTGGGIVEPSEGGCSLIR